MAVSPAGGGTAIDVYGKGEYAEGGKVSIKAQAAAGYQFVNWTAAPAVLFADANAAETTFTMIGEPVTITANFESAGYVLTLAASPDPGRDGGGCPACRVYQAGTVVTIQAVPASGYQFSHWTPGRPAGQSQPGADHLHHAGPGCDRHRYVYACSHRRACALSPPRPTELPARSRSTSCASSGTRCCSRARPARSLWPCTTGSALQSRRSYRQTAS
jgi:hypothetical protein